MASKLKTDQEFSALCLSLTEEEEENLRQSLIDEGCRDPLVVWKGKGIILDGHNRYEICTGEEIQFKTKEIELDDRQACINWIIRNQLGRRNASEEQKAYLRGKLYLESKKPTGHPTNGEECGHSDHISTAERVASETGVSEKTVRRDAVFSEAVDALAEKSPELADAAKRGDLPKSAVKGLAKKTKTELNKLAKLEGSELKEAAKELLNPTEAEDDDTPDVIAEILAAVNSEKLKASRKQLEALAEMDEDTQAEILKSVLAGRESLGTAIANGCAADPTIEEQIKEQASTIESACRQITDHIEKVVEGLTDKWLDGMGARKLALEEFKKGCATLRSCKSVAVCPKCGGTGCRSCLNTGRVNKFTLQQLS